MSVRTTLCFALLGWLARDLDLGNAHERPRKGENR